MDQFQSRYYTQKHGVEIMSIAEETFFSLSYD